MVAGTRRRAAAFAARYEHADPAAVTCLTSTRDDLTVHLRFPRQHRQRAADEHSSTHDEKAVSSVRPEGRS